MANSCLKPHSGTERFANIYGKDYLNFVAEVAMGNQSFDVYSSDKKDMISSTLFESIKRELTHLSKEEQENNAFYIYSMAYSDEFIKKYGNWSSITGKYKNARYRDTGEPHVKVLKEFGLFDPFKRPVKTSDVTDKGLKYLEDSLKELNVRLIKLKKKIFNETDKKKLEDLNELIIDTEKAIEEKEIVTGVRRYLEDIQNNELTKLESQVKGVDNIDIPQWILSDLSEFLDLHKEHLIRLNTALADSAEYKKQYEDTIRPIVRDVSRRMTYLEGRLKNATEEHLIKLVTDAYEGKNVPEPEEIRKWVGDSVKDIKNISKIFMSPKVSGDPLLRVAMKIIDNLHFDVNSVVNPKIDKLIILQEKLKAAGFKDTSIFNEKVDGKKSGFLISEYKWGEYYLAEQKYKQDVAKATGFDSFDEFVVYIGSLPDEERKSDPKYKTFLKLRDKFYAKYKENGKPSPNRNLEFDKLMKDKAFKEYYTLLKDIHFKAKGNQPVSYRTGYLKWQLPQIRNNELESFKKSIKEGGKTLLRKGREIVKTTEDDLEFGDIVRDENGEIIKMVPIHYNSRLENQNELSDDITAIYSKYYRMSENFKQITEVLPQIEIIERSIKGREKPTPHSLESLQTQIDRHLYGMKTKEWKIKLGNKEINAHKVLKILVKDYPAITNMAFNHAVALTGFIKGRIDTNIEKFVGEQITHESSRIASSKLVKLMGPAMMEIGDKKKTNFLDLMMRYLQIDDIMYKSYKNLNIDTEVGRMLTSDLPYAFMQIGTYPATAHLALTIMDNNRLIDGEFITKKDLRRKYKNKSGTTSEKEFKSSKEYKDFKDKWKEASDKTLLNVYHIDNGQFKVKNEYKKYVSHNLERAISRQINTLSDRVEGRLSATDKGQVYNTSFGEGVMLFRGWIPQLFAIRFKPKGYDFDIGEESEGFYNTVVRKYITEFIKAEGSIKQRLAKWNELEEFEKRNIIRFIGDLGMLLVVTLVSWALNSIADDDEEDKWFIEYSAYIANRVLLEQRAMNFIPIVGGGVSEMVAITKSPLAATKMLDNLSNIGRMIVLRGNEELQSGAYKGKTRREKFLIQQSLLKSFYELLYPEIKNSYLKSQML